ncbi:type II secretion system inner membrane protein GspF [Neisseriaceae bacterium JH1-16]|nr:type II secretion system inner membrane protein GspF [Neisseriaceae bacterium JH1-16]
MAAFRFVALAPDGREEKGFVEADSPRSARAQLRERGLVPVSVDGVAAKAAAGSFGRIGRSLPSATLVLLTQQLATLLDAGLPLEKALAAVADQSEDARAKTVAVAIRSSILEGHSLAQALSAQPAVFSPLYRSLVAAGETSGELTRVLLKLADYLENRQHTRQKVILALAYPAVVTLVAVLVVGGLMSFVVPQVVGVFAQTKQTLPLLTRLLLMTSDFLRQWGWLAGLALAGGGYAAFRALKTEALRRRFDARLMKLPVLGRLLVSLDTARMASTLAILAGSGVPLLSALDASRNLLTLLPLREALAETHDKVREGASLARSLGASKRFPPVLTHLIGSGEASGTLPTMLEKVAEQQQREVERKLATLTTLMEPLLILVMGGVVLLIVLAIMLPIIDMNQMVH